MYYDCLFVWVIIVARQRAKECITKISTMAHERTKAAVFIRTERIVRTNHMCTYWIERMCASDPAAHAECSASCAFRERQYYVTHSVCLWMGVSASADGVAVCVRCTCAHDIIILLLTVRVEWLGAECVRIEWTSYDRFFRVCLGAQWAVTNPIRICEHVHSYIAYDIAYSPLLFHSISVTQCVLGWDNIEFMSMFTYAYI